MLCAVRDRAKNLSCRLDMARLDAEIGGASPEKVLEPLGLLLGGCKHFSPSLLNK